MAKPAAPASFSVTRLGPRDFKFTWPKAAGATSYGIRFLKGAQNPPYTKWVDGLKGTTFTGRGFSGDAALRFVVYAQNAEGTSAYREAAGTWYLPLPKPTNLKIKVDPQSNSATLSWGSTAYYQSGLEIERSDGQRWLVGSGTGGLLPKSWTDSNAVGDVSYRVRYFAGAEGAVIDGVQQTRVFGTWSDRTPTVFAGWTAPLAPAVTVANAAVGAAPRVHASFESTDGSPQTAVEVRYRKTGTTTWATVSGATAKYVDLPSNLSAGEYEVQARSRGAAAAWSDWSPVTVFLMVTKPVITITNPPAVFAGGQVTAAWTVAQAEGIPQSQYEVELRRAGDTLVSEAGPGNRAAARLPTDLTNSTAYVLVVSVWCAGVKSAATTRSFTTSFARPAVPALSAVWVEEAGAHEVTVAPGAGGEATAVLTVYRSVDDGAKWESLGDWASGGVFFDYAGRSRGTTQYRAVAETTLGALATTEVDSVADSGAAWIMNTQGEGVGLRYNLNIDVSQASPHSDLVWLDGETVPTLVEDSPKSVTRQVTVAASLFPDWLAGADEDDRMALDAVRLLQTIPGTVTLRLPTGELLVGSVRSVSPSYPAGKLVGVQVTFEEARVL